MKLNQIADIVKKDVPLHYRNEYTATAVFDVSEGKTLSRRIEFIVEMSPIGSKDIRINFLDPLNYPLIPVLKSLKEQIQVLDRKGSLL